MCLGRRSSQSKNASTCGLHLYVNGQGIAELKSGQRVYNSTQIEAQLAAADAEGVPYYLVVSPNTTVAATTAEAVVNTGGQVIVYDAASGTLATA